MNKITDKNKKPDDTVGIIVQGHVLVRDKETKEVIVNKRA